MHSSTATLNKNFPRKKWVRTSETPQCRNPKCCSRKQHENSQGAAGHLADCKGGEHNKNCCFAEGNKACSPDEWEILYSQVELSERDIARRRWLAKWMNGQCSLSEALQAFHDEWGEEELLLMEAA